jgi:hypothetical protein
MKRVAGVLVGAAVAVLTLAGTALASGGDYTNTPSPTTIIRGTGGGGGAGSTAFTGGNVSTAMIAIIALAVVGLVALFVARRRAAHSA